MYLIEKNKEGSAAAATSTVSSHSSPLQSFILLLGGNRAKFVLGTLCAAVIGGSEALLHPLLLKAIFDAVTLRADFGRFVYLVGFYLGLGLSINLLSYILSLWNQKLDNNIIAQASENLLRAYFVKDYDGVMRQGAGYYIGRIRSDVKDGLVPMLPLVRRMTANIFIFAILISVLIFISWQAFLVLAIIIPVATTVSLMVSKKIQGLTSAERDNEAELLNVLTKSVSAFKIVRTFLMVPQTLIEFSKKVDAVLDSGYKKFRVVNGLQRGSDITMVISDACCIFVGAFFVFRRNMTIGSYIGFTNSFWRSATTLIEIFRQWAELHGHSATIMRLVSFISELPTAPYCVTENSVSAKDISYGYGPNLIISKFSMCVAAGQSALIVGNNGSGKTTLANILSGYLIPSAGEVKLPARISSVTLPVQFPPIPVSELGIDQELLVAFKIDGLEVLSSHPDQLSAGQQQKLSLAMALSFVADLYVLDEPLANLDMSSRSIAMREIQQRTRGKILVMIMHGAEEYSTMFDQTYILSDSHIEPRVAVH